MTNPVQNKYEIFASLSRELTDLIKNLEKELKDKLNVGPNAPAASKPLVKTPVEPGKTLGYKIGNRLGSFWNRLSRPSLKEYSEYMGVVDALYGELIKENFNILSEDYNQASPIIDKFKVDFIKVLVKYQNILKPEAEKEITSADQAQRKADQEEIKKTGAPDTTVSAEEGKKLSDEIGELKPKIKQSVSEVLKDDMQTEEIDAGYFSDGGIDPKYFGKILEWLVLSNVDIQDEEKVTANLKSRGYRAGNFVSLLQHSYSQDEIKNIIFKIENKKLIIPNGIDGVIKAFEELISSNIKEAKSLFHEINILIDDEKSKKEALSSLAGMQDPQIRDRIEFTILSIFTEEDMHNMVSKLVEENPKLPDLLKSVKSA